MSEDTTETKKPEGSVPAGGTDEAKEHAEANPEAEPAEAAPAGGEDAAREAAKAGTPGGTEGPTAE